MKKHVVVFEWAGTNYSAYVPDLSGCISTGKTLGETEQTIKEAIDLYLETLCENSQPAPEPTPRAQPIVVTT